MESGKKCKLVERNETRKLSQAQKIYCDSLDFKEFCCAYKHEIAKVSLDTHTDTLTSRNAFYPGIWSWHDERGVEGGDTN